MADENINAQVTTTPVLIYDPDPAGSGLVNGPMTTLRVRCRIDHATEVEDVHIYDDGDMNPLANPARIPAGASETFRVGFVTKGRDSLGKVWAVAASVTNSRIDVYGVAKVPA